MKRMPFMPLPFANIKLSACMMSSIDFARAWVVISDSVVLPRSFRRFHSSKPVFLLLLPC